MKRLHRLARTFLFLALSVCAFVSAHANTSDVASSKPNTSPRVFMIGDSTMSNKPLDLPERGWGMVLPGYFKDPAMIHNHAKNGRSTKSFVDEGLWSKVINEVTTTRRRRSPNSTPTRTRRIAIIFADSYAKPVRRAGYPFSPLLFAGENSTLTAS